MLIREPVRRLVSSRSAGKGRVVSIYYSPLNLRYEIDLRGVTTMVIGGGLRSARALAIQEGERMLAELRAERKG